MVSGLNSFVPRTNMFGDQLLLCWQKRALHCLVTPLFTLTYPAIKAYVIWLRQRIRKSKQSTAISTDLCRTEQKLAATVSLMAEAPKLCYFWSVVCITMSKRKLVAVQYRDIHFMAFEIFLMGRSCLLEFSQDLSACMCIDSQKRSCSCRVVAFIDAYFSFLLQET